MIDFKKYFIVGTNSDALHDTMNGIVTGELIRCKDCYFYDTFQRKHYCTKYDHAIKQDGFCAWAERKEEWTK